MCPHGQGTSVPVLADGTVVLFVETVDDWVGV
jgi:hypothetical protein